MATERQIVDLISQMAIDIKSIYDYFSQKDLPNDTRKNWLAFVEKWNAFAAIPSEQLARNSDDAVYEIGKFRQDLENWQNLDKFRAKPVEPKAPGPISIPDSPPYPKARPFYPENPPYPEPVEQGVVARIKKIPTGFLIAGGVALGFWLLSRGNK